MDDIDHRPTRPRFGEQVSTRVRSYLDDARMRRAYHQLHRKALLVAAWYVASFVLVVVADGWLLGTIACVSLTFAIVAVGFDIQHDANHNAMFDAHGRRQLSFANRLAGLSMNAIGGSAKRWVTGHVYQHHRAPNVDGRDDDIDLGPLARLAPTQPRRRWHSYQQYYVWFFYGFTAVAIIVGDVTATLHESITRRHTPARPRLRDYAALTGSKLLVLFAFVAIPAFLHPWWVVAIGTLGVLFGVGLLLGVVFQLAHTVEDAAFASATARPAMPWHEWQVRATADFSHGRDLVARAITWYTGSLNYQIEHHLFPNLPHTAYPAIAPIVAAACRENDIPYRLQPTLRAAIAAHYRHLRRLGSPTFSPSGVPPSAPAPSRA